VSLFVDTSVLYAAADRGDRGHKRAVGILSGREDLVVSDHILAECWLLSAGRLGHEAAERLWAAIRAGAARVELVGDGDLEAAWQIGRAFEDQGFSLVDRTSFAVMERLGIHRVASFDDHFAVFRFGARRERAFDVLR
jgi:predicted nucleic acid-binding protein